MPLLFQRLLDRLRHLQLPATEFICRMRARQDSAGPEKLVQRGVLAACSWAVSRRSRGGLRAQSHRSLYNTSSGPHIVFVWERVSDSAARLEDRLRQESDFDPANLQFDQHA